MRDRLGVVRSGNAPTREVKRAVDVAGAEKGDVAFNARDASLADEEFFGRVAPAPFDGRRARVRTRRRRARTRTRAREREQRERRRGTAVVAR